MRNLIRFVNLLQVCDSDYLLSPLRAVSDRKYSLK